jgi:phosphoglycolate phosphatase
MAVNIFRSVGIIIHMPCVKLIIFDLDGTVNDSSPGIIYCFRKTGESYGKVDLSDEWLRNGLSGPFEVNILKLLDLRPDQVDEAIQEYVKYYVESGQKMARLFEGIRDTLGYLKSRGYLLGVATMMVDEYARSTLDSYGITELFDTIHGTSFDFAYHKEDLIRACLADTGVSPEEAVMIGDGSDDYRAARAADVEFIGALYGYEIDTGFCTQNGIRGISDITELKTLF